MNRCANCIQPHHAHRKRMEAAPACPNGKSAYREMTEEELDTAYRAEFGDGPPEPIATFRADNPADMERAAALLSPEALNGFFGAGGGGMPAFMAAVEGRKPANVVTDDPPMCATAARLSKLIDEALSGQPS